MRAPLTRRSLLSSSAAGLAGGSALVASACGVEAEEPSDARDVELLTRSLEAEGAVAAAYGGSSGAAAQESEQIAVLAEQIDVHTGAIEDLIADAGGEAGAPAETPGGETGPEAAATALAEAIATHRDVLGDLTADRRVPVAGVMANDAQQLAVLRGLLGEEPVPFAFVTGSDEPPLGEPTEEELQEAIGSAGEEGSAEDEAGTEPTPEGEQGDSGA